MSFKIIKRGAIDLESKCIVTPATDKNTPLPSDMLLTSETSLKKLWATKAEDEAWANL